MSKTNKRRNPVHKELIEDAKFRLKVHNPKKDMKAPTEPSIEEAIIELQEEEELNEKDSS